MNKEYVVYIVLIALNVLGKYLINQKAGIKGWYAFIPFYNSYLLYKYANTQKYYFVVLLTSIIGSIALLFSCFVSIMLLIAHTTNQDKLHYLLSDNTSITIPISSITKVVIIGLIIAVILLGISFYFRFKMCRGLALNFNAEKSFAWVIFFFELIAQLILAFGEEYYYIPLNKMEDTKDGNI